MDYSVKGILVMLQDLQRIHFGNITMYLDVVLSDEYMPIVSCNVFDKGGEPHLITFYTFDSEEKHKEDYLKVLELVYENTTK